MIRRSLAVIFSLGLAGPAFAQSIQGPMSPIIGSVTPSGPLSFTPPTAWNPKDHQAACDGSANDTSAFSGAPASSPIVISGLATLCNTTFAFTGTPNWLVGPGQIIGADTNHRAPITTNLSAVPSSFGSAASATTLFNGDLSHVFFAHQHIVTGAATLSQPVSAYTIFPEASAEILSVYNTSGWNQSNSGNGGRTGLEGRYTLLTNGGQGDLNANYVNGLVNSTNPSATSYLASPEVAGYGGQLTSTVDGSYLEFGDQNISDNNHDIAAAWLVGNLTRNVATEGIGANWTGLNVASLGTAPIDIGLRLRGPIVQAIDMSSATLSNYRLASFALTPSGANYCVGDTVSVIGGTLVGPATSWVVSNTSGGSGAGNCGSILAGGLTIVNSGIYSAAPVASFTTLTLATSGSGTGLSMTGQYANASAMVLPAAGGCIRPGQSTGSPITMTTGVFSSLCITLEGMSFGGLNNTTTSGNGSNNFRFGDHHNTNGTGNTQLGQWTYDNARLNGLFFSSGSFVPAGQGKSQTGEFIFRREGTGTLRLTTDNGTPVANNTYSIPTTSDDSVEWRCVARDTTTAGNSASWNVRNGLAHRDGANASYTGAGTTALAADTSVGTGSTATMQITADTTLQSLNVAFVPPAGGDSWRAECRMDFLQVTS